MSAFHLAADETAPTSNTPGARLLTSIVPVLKLERLV